MLHPSYSDLMKIVNSEAENSEQPVVQSRYSIVMATAKRARQIIAASNQTETPVLKKPLSTAVEELYDGKTKILGAAAEDEEVVVETSEDVSDGASDDILEAAPADVNDEMTKEVSEEESADADDESEETDSDEIEG